MSNFILGFVLGALTVGVASLSRLAYDRWEEMKHRAERYDA